MILLYSGGMDSYIAYHYLEKPATLYIPLGHRYQKQEKKAIAVTIPETIIDPRLSLGDWETEDAHIPMRNAFLCMIASHYEKEIVLVTQRGEMDIPDRSPKFFHSFSAWLSWMNEGSGYHITSPFFEMTKTDMVKWYLDKGLSSDNLLLTRSCFSVASMPCGRCGACFRRWVALTNNGLVEETLYPILEWEGTYQYIQKMKDGKYEERRTDETLRALKSVGMID